MHPGLRLDVFGACSNAAPASVRIDTCHGHAGVRATFQESILFDVFIILSVFFHCGYVLIAWNTPSAGALAPRHLCFPSNNQYRLKQAHPFSWAKVFGR